MLHTPPSRRCIEPCARCPNLKKNDLRHRSLSTSARTLAARTPLPRSFAISTRNDHHLRSILRSAVDKIPLQLILDRSQLDRKPLHRRHFSAHFAIIILTSVIFVTPVGIEVAAPLDQPTRVLIASLSVSLPSVLCIVEIVVKLKDSRFSIERLCHVV